MFYHAAEWEKKEERNRSNETLRRKRPTGTWSSVVRKMAYLPVRIASSGNSASDKMFWYSFRLLRDRLKLIRLYPCGSLRQSISFVFGAWVGHVAVTPQSDVVGHVIWASWQRFRYDRKCRFSCIYNPQITVSPTSSFFKASFNGNRVKNHP